MNVTNQNSRDIVYVTVCTNIAAKVSSLGKITAAGGSMHVGIYVAQGTDSVDSGDTRSWRNLSSVTPITIIQLAPRAGLVSKALSGGFNRALAPTSENGNPHVLLAVTSNVHLSESGAGRVTVVGGPLVVCTYGVSGTDADSASDIGKWTYALAVMAGNIIQIPPFSASMTQCACSGSSIGFEAAGSEGPAASTVTSSDDPLKVSSSGQIFIDGNLGAGNYIVSGTEADSINDTGTWNFTFASRG